MKVKVTGSFMENSPFAKYPKVLEKRIEKRMDAVTEEIKDEIVDYVYDNHTEYGDMAESFSTECGWDGKKTYVCKIMSDSEYLKWHLIGTGIYNPNGRKDVPWGFEDKKGKLRFTKGLPQDPFTENIVIQNEKKILNAVHKAAYDTFDNRKGR